MKIGILYERFFDFDGQAVLVGGVETYIATLAEALRKNGWCPIIFQKAGRDFRRHSNGTLVVGVEEKAHGERSLKEALQGELDFKRDIIIFASELSAINGLNVPSIIIQHGIPWDLPGEHEQLGGYRLFIDWLKRAKLIRRRLKLMQHSDNIVCVDYNFWNWYRATFIKKLAQSVTIIPNFSSLADENSVIEKRQIRSKIIKILFARRFTNYRGCSIMAEAIEDILPRRPNVEFTFAGEGPEEIHLRRRFNGEPRVTFTRYEHSDASRVNFEHHIAVVPSLGSEGTSLSVLEAMGTGATVVATMVGGITNIIIDGYNGILVSPYRDSLIDGLLRAIDDHDLRLRLGKCAYTTVKYGFGIDSWEKKWVRLIQSISTA